MGPKRLVLTLYFLTAASIGVAVVTLVQYALGQMVDGQHRLSDTPLTHFIHAGAGATFGLIGPLQFYSAFKRKFGQIHKILGRIYVASGTCLALSAIHLLITHPLGSTPVLDITRALMGIAVGVSIWVALRAALARDIPRHKAWMIRSYTFGMGSSPIVFVYLPYLILADAAMPPLVNDLQFVVIWGVCILVSERVIRRMQQKT
jgi:uncharacterized membrane protein